MLCSSILEMKRLLMHLRMVIMVMLWYHCAPWLAVKVDIQYAFLKKSKTFPYKTTLILNNCHISIVLLDLSKENDVKDDRTKAILAASHDLIAALIGFDFLPRIRYLIEVTYSYTKTSSPLTSHVLTPCPKPPCTVYTPTLSRTRTFSFFPFFISKYE